MVRRFAVLALVTLTGCSGLRDAISAHQDVVAQAGGQALTVNHLAELIAPIKNVPLRREVVDRVAELWADWQLLGQATAQGDSLLDSATVAAANWPAMMPRRSGVWKRPSISTRKAALSTNWKAANPAVNLSTILNGIIRSSCIVPTG